MITELLFLMRICLGVAVTVRNPLGDITLSLNETASVPLTETFAGFILDYCLEDVDSELVSILSTGRYVLNTVTPLEPRYRKAGSVFFLNGNSHFVLYSVSTLELWRGEEQTVTKVWEIPISYSIAGIDSIKDDWRLGLVYWTLSTLESAFFFVDLAKPPTSVEILRIPTYPNMKVSICEYKPLIILSWINETKHYIAYYSLAINSTQATLAHLYADFSLEILQSICVDKAYFLTSEGLYQNSYPSFFSNEKIQRFLPTKQNITSITKMSRDTFSVQTEHELIFYHEYEEAFAILPNFAIGRDLQIVKADKNYLKALYSNEDGSNTAIARFITSKCSRFAKIPGDLGKTIIDIYPDWSFETDLLAFLREDAVSVYSVTYGEVALQAKSADHPYTLSICASEHFKLDDRECIFSTVRTLPLLEDHIMSKDGYNLTSNPTDSVITELPINEISRKTWAVSSLFSGSNVRYTGILQEVPKFLKVTLELNERYSKDTEISFPCPLNQSIICVDSTSSDIVLISRSENKILFRYPLRVSSRVINLREDEHLVACSVHKEHVLFIVEDEKKARNLYMSKELMRVSITGRIEECKSAAVAGICWSEDQIIGIKWNSVEPFQIEKALNDHFLSIWTRDETILILRTGKLEFGVLTSDGFINLGTCTVPETATRIIGYFDQIIVHHSAGHIAVYRVLLDYQIVLTKKYYLHNCTFQDFDTSADSLVVICLEYIQVIDLLALQHNAKIFAIPPALTYIQYENSLYPKLILHQIVKNDTECQLVTFVATHDSAVQMRLRTDVLDTEQFGSTKKATIAGIIVASNENGSKLILPFLVDIKNFGKFLSLKPNLQHFQTIVPMDDSFRLDLDDFVIGQNASFSFSAPECRDLCSVTNWVEVTHHLPIPNYALSHTGLCPDLNLTFTIQSEGLVVSRYLCKNIQCQVVWHTLIGPTDLYVGELLSSQVVLCTGSFVIVVISGANYSLDATEKEYLQIWGKFDTRKRKMTVLISNFTDERSIDFQLCTESEDIVHIFTRRLNHYILSVQGEEITIEECSDLTELPILVDSLSCVVVGNELRLYVLDRSQKVLEFVKDVRFRLRRTVLFLNLRGDEYILDLEVSAGKAFLLTNLQWLHIYSVPEFDLVRSVYISYQVFQLFNKLHTFPTKEGAIGFVALYLRPYTTVTIINVTAIDHSETVAAVQCRNFQFTSPNEGVCFSKSHISFLKLQRPVLEIAPDRIETDSYSFPIGIYARNEQGSIEIPEITINRSSRRSVIPLFWIGIGGGVLFICICCYMYKRWRRMQGRNNNGIELRSLTAENSK